MEVMTKLIEYFCYSGSLLGSITAPSCHSLSVCNIATPEALFESLSNEIESHGILYDWLCI